MDIAMNEISLRRLKGQQIAGSSFTKPPDVVAFMGAMQAQDYSMARWAIGVRLPHATQAQIQGAIDIGEIIRTHVLRPTWHLVSPKDVSWMLTLTSPYIRAALKSRHRELEFTPAIVKKGCRIIEKAIAHSGALTREEIVQKLQAGNINTAEQRAVHLLLLAELDQLICSGPLKGNKNTFALFSDRVPQSKALHREEAAATLCMKYFESHGPATVQDFTWWSGLPPGEAKKALASVNAQLMSETVGSTTYWFKASAAAHTTEDTLFLLPAFDEFVISYKDRSASLALSHNGRAISSNGIFRAMIVYNGQVIGLWKKTRVRNKHLIETDLFPKLKISKTEGFRKKLSHAVARVVEFYDDEAGPPDGAPPDNITGRQSGKSSARR
jgi:hypothetical protein